MISLWSALIIIVVSWTSYWWYRKIKIEKQLRWLPKVAGWPVIGNVLEFRDSKEIITTIMKYHKNYDGLCYSSFAGFYGILAAEPKFLELILSSNTILEKGREYRFIHSWLGQGLLTGSGARWKQSRKILTPAFHFSILEQFVDVFDSKADILVKILEDKVEIHIYFNALLVLLLIVDNNNMALPDLVLVHLTFHIRFKVFGMCVLCARWKQSRKILTPAFHFSILEQFVDVFDSKADILVKILEDKVEKEIDIFPFVTLYALDVICDTAMGISVDAQQNEDSEYVYAVQEMCRIGVERARSPFKMFDILYPLSRDYYKEKKYIKLLHSRTQSVIKRRREELSKIKKRTDDSSKDCDVGMKKKRVFLDILLESTVDGKLLPDEYIREEVDTFMFAGHDTTATAIGFTIYCLANHPDVQEKVFREQLELFDSNLKQPQSYRLLQEMKYLEMVIKESLRLYPSVPIYIRQAVEDTVIKDGKTIPKGTSIVISAFGVNRNPKDYMDAEIFNPDRFAKSETKSPYSYLPFSAGPRNCIGQKFAMLEIKSAVSKVIRHFKILPTDPKHEVVLAAETVLKSLNGIKIKLTKRE